MAGDWIKFEISTPDKPEVWAIASALSIDHKVPISKGGDNSLSNMQFLCLNHNFKKGARVSVCQ